MGAGPAVRIDIEEEEPPPLSAEGRLTVKLLIAAIGLVELEKLLGGANDEIIRRLVQSGRDAIDELGFGDDQDEGDEGHDET